MVSAVFEGHMLLGCMVARDRILVFFLIDRQRRKALPLLGFRDDTAGIRAH